MIANGGDSEGLFHAAVMQSGSPIPVGDIANGQPIYDAVVSATGCSVTADTLKCLKAVPFDKLRKAIDAVPDIFSYSVCCFTLSTFYN
jgi:carboxylesterase type B